MEAVALNKTEEFTNLTKFVQEIKFRIEGGEELSGSYTTLRAEYEAQKDIVSEA